MNLRMLLPTLLLVLSPLTMLAIADAPPAPLNADSTLDQVLDALDARGKQLQDFTADVKLIETDNIVASQITRAGKILYQTKGNGDARLRVNFSAKIDDKGISIPQKLEYLLDDGWLTDRNYDKKMQVRRQVQPPGQKVNLLKLGEGPFPLPIGQDKADVHREFNVEKLPPAKDDPANSIHVKLSPKPGTKLAKKFKTIDVWVDMKTDMPARISALDKNQTLIRTTELSNIQVNTNLPADAFTLPPIEKWSERVEAFDNK